MTLCVLVYSSLFIVDYQSALSLGMQSNGTPDSSSSSETNAAVGKTVVVSSTTKDAETEH